MMLKTVTYDSWGNEDLRLLKGLSLRSHSTPEAAIALWSSWRCWAY